MKHFFVFCLFVLSTGLVLAQVDTVHIALCEWETFPFSGHSTNNPPTELSWEHWGFVSGPLGADSLEITPVAGVGQTLNETVEYTFSESGIYYFSRQEFWSSGGNSIGPNEWLYVFNIRPAQDTATFVQKTTCDPDSVGSHVDSLFTEFGCDSVVITEVSFIDTCDQKKNCDIYVPNAFSPNGDGVNDLFMIFSDRNCAVTIRSFKIFDRWGNWVFSAKNFSPNDFSFGWDGRHRGLPMNPAVFVWFAEVEFEDGHVELRKGDVTLVR